MMGNVAEIRASLAGAWSGPDIPERSVASAFAYGPMRGDEVFTEELATAITRRDERCLVVTVPGDADGCVCVAAALRDAGSSGEAWMVETAAPLDRPELHHALVHGVIAHVGPQAAVRWRPPTSGSNDHFPSLPGSLRERTIVEMHAGLPLVGSESYEPPSPVRFRDFAADSDDDTVRQSTISAIVRINNAAFSDHPEQGEMSAGSFAFRTLAPWFDTHGLTIASVDDHDIGFVWMKCDPPRPAELYVVAVDPGVGTKGLGRALVHHGFAHAIADHGATEAMLFVDASNERAVGLYESLGFRGMRRQDVVRIAAPEA